MTESSDQPLCVLVAEDDASLRHTLVDVLRDAGHIVDEASNGAVALEKALMCLPDVVVVDYMMPVADGTALIESIRSIIRPRPSLVMISGATSAARWCTEHGVDIFHAKPFSLETFLHTVEYAGRLAAEARPSARFSLAPVHSACVMAVGSAARDLESVLPSALSHARIVVVESLREALDILGEISPELVVITDSPAQAPLRDRARARHIPCIVRPRGARERLGPS